MNFVVLIPLWLYILFALLCVGIVIALITAVVTAVIYLIVAAVAVLAFLLLFNYSPALATVLAFIALAYFHFKIAVVIAISIAVVCLYGKYVGFKEDTIDKPKLIKYKEPSEGE